MAATALGRGLRDSVRQRHPAALRGARLGAPYLPGIPETHASVLADGWPSVYAEGRRIGYIGAPVACGSAVADGSPNVFVGG